MTFAARKTRHAQAMPSKLRIVAPFLLMGAFYWLSSLPSIPIPHDTPLYHLFYLTPPSLQNALHIPAYATLTLTWSWALSSWLRVTSTRAILACAIASAYGVLDEYHQTFVPGRYASLFDVALNFAGASLGVWLAKWIETGTGNRAPSR